MVAVRLRRDDRVAFGVERDGTGVRPVASRVGPACRVERTSAGVQRMARGQDGVIFTGVALCRFHGCTNARSRRPR